MPRRKIQRSFLSWLEENRTRFAIEIKLGRRTDRVLEFSFEGINNAIKGSHWLSDENIDHSLIPLSDANSLPINN